LDTIPLGKHNTRLVSIRKAVQKGTLTEDGLLPIEGPNLLSDALRARCEIPAVFLREDLSLPAEFQTLRSFSLDMSAFRTIQATEHSQGLVALVRLPSWNLANILEAGAGKPVVVLDELQDPGNVGTILRIAEAFGAAGCIGLRGTCAIHNAKVVRSSAGSIFRLPHFWNADWDDLLSALNSARFSLVGTSPHASTSIADWDWSKSTALLVGNEGRGLSGQHLSECAATLRIPQETSVESLNSAVATAVILYEARRGRKA